MCYVCETLASMIVIVSLFFVMPSYREIEHDERVAFWLITWKTSETTTTTTKML